MCGIIGIFGPEDVKDELYLGLLMLQHRGQDAAGIVTWDGERFNLKKREGLVREVFNNEDLDKLKGNIGLGHIRYATVGEGGEKDAQPFFKESPFAIAMDHNGNSTNFLDLKKKFGIKSNCDLEAILEVFASGFKSKDEEKTTIDDIFNAVELTMDKVKGAYSTVALIANKGLLAFRDPFGIRPLVFGEKINDRGKSYIFASETVVLDKLRYKLIRNVLPGEAIFINTEREFISKQIKEGEHYPCAFEWIYLAWPTSNLDGVSVSEARENLGKSLAKQLEIYNIKPDIVIEVPSTSEYAARSLAEVLKIPYKKALVRGYYTGRSFIENKQKNREDIADQKLTFDRRLIEGKNVLVVDDSIVRGTTSKKLIETLREYGALEVYFVSTAPPIRHPCVYGVDMSTYGELIAHNKTIPEIRMKIGANFLLYQEVEDLSPAIGKRKLCTACFTGCYPTGISNEEIEKIEEERIESRVKK